MFGAYCDTLANYAIRQTKKRRKKQIASGLLLTKLQERYKDYWTNKMFFT